MSRTIRRRAALAALALSVALVSSAARSAGDEEDKKAYVAAQKAALDLSRKLDKSGGTEDTATLAKKIAKAHDLEYVMGAAFRPRAKGGVGVGEKEPPPGLKDSVELAIIDMATSRKPNPGQAILDKNNADFVKLAEITRAMAEINHFYKPEKAKPKKDPKDWQRLNDDMKASSKDLLDAVKAKDQTKVTAAAKKLNASCTECHNIFRDSN